MNNYLERILMVLLATPIIVMTTGILCTVIILIAAAVPVAMFVAVLAYVTRRKL